jgi:hypothetical protein
MKTKDTCCICGKTFNILRDSVDSVCGNTTCRGQALRDLQDVINNVGYGVEAGDEDWPDYHDEESSPAPSSHNLIHIEHIDIHISL